MTYYVFASEKPIIRASAGTSNDVLQMQYDEDGAGHMWTIVTQLSPQQACAALDEVLRSFVRGLDDELWCDATAYFRTGNEVIIQKGYGTEAEYAGQEANFNVHCGVVDFRAWLDNHTANGTETIVTHIVMPAVGSNELYQIVPIETYYPGDDQDHIIGLSY